MQAVKLMIREQPVHMTGMYCEVKKKREDNGGRNE